jgi:hypothetical protein
MSAAAPGLPLSVVDRQALADTMPERCRAMVITRTGRGAGGGTTTIRWIRGSTKWVDASV